MSMASQAPPTGAGSVHIVGDPCHRIVVPDGVAVDVLASYPVRPDADLYSLAAAIVFRCSRCEADREATLIAVRDRWLVCPGCYASLDEHAPTLGGPPDHQTAA